MTKITKSVEAARAHAEDNLVEGCREIRHWNMTGALPETAHVLREIANRLPADCGVYGQRLSLAEGMVKNLAVGFVIDECGT